MNFWRKKDKSYYSCKCLEETVVLHKDWYSICSMFGHINHLERPIFYWDDRKGFDYKNFLKVKRKIIAEHKKGKINKGCIGCKDLEKKEWKGKVDKINHIHFRLSKKCNAKCIYCRDKIDNINPDRPFFDDLKMLIKKNVLDKNALMEFGGGEFTLHDEFDKIFRYLLDKGFRRFKVYTSCLKYSQELAEALSFGECEVIISVDAGDKETFIKMKQADTYDRFFQNLSKYIMAQNENKLQVVSKYIIFKGINDSKEQINLFLQKSKEMGIKKVYFDIDCKDIHKMQLEPDREEMEYLCNLVKYAKNQAKNVYNLIFDKFIYVQLFEKYYPEMWE